MHLRGNVVLILADEELPTIRIDMKAKHFHKLEELRNESTNATMIKDTMDPLRTIWNRTTSAILSAASIATSTPSSKKPCVRIHVEWLNRSG